MPYDAGEGALSAAAIATPPVYDRARAAARYSETMRELIQSFKYRDRQEGLPLFARWLGKAGAELLADADLIVPVPLYPARLWWRRFNQSAMLAQAVGRLTGVEVDCFVLKRVKRTASQVGLSADQRRRNVAGAFKVDKARAGRIRGKKVVVIDDVITTGATAEACARALKRARAPASTCWRWRVPSSPPPSCSRRHCHPGLDPGIHAVKFQRGELRWNGLPGKAR